jgi:hypothetical protein
VILDDKDLTAREMLKFVCYRPGAARAYGVTFLISDDLLHNRLSTEDRYFPEMGMLSWSPSL